MNNANNNIFSVLQGSDSEEGDTYYQGKKTKAQATKPQNNVQDNSGSIFAKKGQTKKQKKKQQLDQQKNTQTKRQPKTSDHLVKDQKASDDEYERKDQDDAPVDSNPAQETQNPVNAETSPNKMAKVENSGGKVKNTKLSAIQENLETLDESPADRSKRENQIQIEKKMEALFLDQNERTGKLAQNLFVNPQDLTPKKETVAINPPSNKKKNSLLDELVQNPISSDLGHSNTMQNDLNLNRKASYQEKKHYQTFTLNRANSTHEPNTINKPHSNSNANINPSSNLNNIKEESKWPNEKQDFFEYLKYLLYEDSMMSYKEMTWIRRVMCKFCHLEPPMNSKGKPVSLFFKKQQLYSGDMGLIIDSIQDYDEDIYFTGFVKGNGPRKELFYGRLFVLDDYEVTLYQGAFKDKGRISGKNVRVYSPRGELEFEGEV